MKFINKDKVITYIKKAYKRSHTPQKTYIQTKTCPPGDNKR